MVYSLRYNSLLSTTDGSIENIQDSFDKYDIIDYYYILPEAGELYYEGQKYEITEPSILFKMFTTEKGKAPEIIITPCASVINKLVELKEKRDNYRKSRECENYEKVCCDCCSN